MLTVFTFLSSPLTFLIFSPFFCRVRIFTHTVNLFLDTLRVISLVFRLPLALLLSCMAPTSTPTYISHDATCAAYNAEYFTLVTDVGHLPFNILRRPHILSWNTERKCHHKRYLTSIILPTSAIVLSKYTLTLHHIPTSCVHHPSAFPVCIPPHRTSWSSH